MQRALIIAAVIHCFGASHPRAVTLPFEGEDAEPFYSPKFEVVWEATNKLPARITIFKIVPASFSSLAISNVTALGGSADRKRGWMSIFRPTDARLPLENVPDKARAYELGTNLLAKLEFPFDELMSDGGKPAAWYSSGTRGHMDKATRKMVVEPCTMAVQFRRMLDGVECFGQQVRIQFERQEAITQLEVKWHGVQPYKTCTVATLEEIILWIKEGRARAHPIETTGSRWINVADIRKVTIRQVRLCYDAEPNWANPENIPTYLYPYAAIEIEVEFSAKDREIIGISCPIIREALSSPVRETSEFNILPKSFYEVESRREEPE